MTYRIVMTLAVVLVFVFAVTRTHDDSTAPATITAPASDEPNTKGLQIPSN